MNELWIFQNKGTDIKPLNINIEEEIKEISSGTPGTMITTTNGKLYEYQSNQNIKKLSLEDVVKARVSYEHFLILKSDGTVYSYGRNTYGHQGHGNSSQSLDSPKRIEFFIEKKIFIKDIACGCYQSYFITSNNDLYSCGYNVNCETGVSGGSNIWIPIFVSKNVSRVFSDDYAFHFFFQDFSGNFYSSGRNGAGQLGINSKSSVKGYQLVPDLCDKKVIMISCSYQHSIAIIENEKGFHEIWIAGGTFQPSNGSFRKVEGFNDKRVSCVSGCCWDASLLTEDLELYLPNSDKDYKPYPQKESLKLNNKHKHLMIETGRSNSIIYSVSLTFSVLQEDLQRALSLNDLVDVNIKGIDGVISAHKIFIEQRICIKNEILIEKLLEFLETKTIKEIQEFLEFIYTGTTKNYLILREIEEEFKIQNIIEKTGGINNLEKDFSELFYEEETKDFKIICQNEEIKVHKFILLVRSDLFRGMFISVTDSSNQVSDYNNRTPVEIKSIIKLMYFGTFDSDTPIEVINDFQDIIDYYQLNPRMNHLIENSNK
ncbi:btk-binding protein-related [Anaeramoeba ignava]|uniref:Btk-binding protein-related n=1 Tax=Anaeramoeba ignava TaxID=1746090 RepID=A0A9Q0LV32_ANAIG|nr:btk-binding protein-related [Anaeramoeba ignava]